ncbi:hypothetical protein [Paenarthrobacter aurescens]|jgi:hypothetical protein|uniref:Conserved domain protein n=1 Tax=Paenarthrobacter aurescens (strain TC1) TaxID=290340 RepID=A1R0V6_PAEAT|nr:hypothetical protein [Paenarthrobacter aurescens]ABM08618.1 conserved domain protein [Paenarthrobacter aurescens TC1]
MYLYYKSSGLVVAAAETSHSHLFPGAVVKVRGSGMELVVTFSDGATAAAEIVDDGGKPALVVEAYTTGAGKEITRNVVCVCCFC